LFPNLQSPRDVHFKAQIFSGQLNINHSIDSKTPMFDV